MGHGIESIDPIFDNYLKKYKKIYSQLENDEFFDNGEISVKILKNISTTVDYIYVPATGRYGYVSTSVYK